MIPDINNELLKLSAEFFKETISNRHYLHQHPELSFQEFNTALYVEQKLKNIGLTEVHRLSNTGVVALLKADKNVQGKVVALRADLDALPIIETNDIPYKSLNKCVMHACGHDVHTAVLLTVAKILFKLKDKIEGNIKFIFQPGEELLPGGASLMIDEGVLKNPEVDCLIAQHVTPDIPAGKIGFRPGLFMASTDEIYIKVKGKGGHAAMPHTYTNPLLLSSAIITELHKIFMIEKQGNTHEIPTVLAFGKIIGEGATNVIPDEVNMAGTFRTLNEEWRKRCHQTIKETVKNLSQLYGGICDIEIKYGYPCLVNDETLTEACINTARNILGNDNILSLDYRMTAEDFAFYSHHKPVCFYRLGTGNKLKNTCNGVHTSVFNIDEDVLEYAPAIMAAMAINALS